MADATQADWDKLRKAFDPKVVGKLPRGGTQLDYVGHAAVTDRLLSVDPQWLWEPLAVDELGLPALDADGNPWIKLTVLGVTRLGVGDGRSAKERIGDALRNAAMRFGVALDLWSKDELESTLTDPETKNVRQAQAQPRPDVKALAAQLAELMQQLYVIDPEDKTEFYMQALGKGSRPSTINELTKAIEYAKTALADHEEAATLPGANE